MRCNCSRQGDERAARDHELALGPACSGSQTRTALANRQSQILPGPGSQSTPLRCLTAIVQPAPAPAPWPTTEGGQHQIISVRRARRCPECAPSVHPAASVFQTEQRTSPHLLSQSLNSMRCCCAPLPVLSECRDPLPT